MAAAIIRNYAQVLYELSIPEEDIKTSQRLLAENPALCQVLNHPVLDEKKKCQVVDRIFPESMQNFMKVVCKNQRTLLLLQMFEEYTVYRNQREGILEATLRFVDAPDEKQEQNMCDFLKKEYHVKSILLKKEQDTDLIGGFILQVGNYEYDWSLKGRITRLEQKITGR
ncbi:MAG: ATP synthase F1 subunit delta [Lachnospiraceae bacterium]|nr:ATP synthase F1 subunit delta [Lachnospiraceae bacterium]MDD3615087.1 ATP synthase F1 subunit delta [Lachnospiraceae bacterium]